MSVTIDMSDPARREAIALLQMRAMLSIEVKTGMRHSRGSVLTLAQQKFGIKARTKKAAIVEIEKLLATQYNFNVKQPAVEIYSE